MRLFVAIDVPDSVKEHLSFLQRSLDFRGLRLVPPKNIHLTLNFLGERDGYGDVMRALERVSFRPFTLRLAGVGFFPSRDDPRVLWVGLEDADGLRQLQRQVDLLFEPPKSFRPHLTIARFRRKCSAAEKARIVSVAESLSVKPLSFRVSSFKLYKSMLTPVGPVYEVLHSFKAE
ncbi:MAG: RNA 2',3'-cyclic phosphodiesterase [Candidatus Woesearchaeota archaeon]